MSTADDGSLAIGTCVQFSGRTSHFCGKVCFLLFILLQFFSFSVFMFFPFRVINSKSKVITADEAYIRHQEEIVMILKY